MYNSDSMPRNVSDAAKSASGLCLSVLYHDHYFALLYIHRRATSKADRSMRSMREYKLTTVTKISVITLGSMRLIA